MSEPLNNPRLLAAIQATIPTVGISRVFLRKGRWWAATRRGSAHPITAILNQEREATVRRKEAQSWRANLTDETAKAVEIMVRRLLRGNPNSQFVREQYPQLFAEITAEQQAAQTTHQSK